MFLQRTFEAGVTIAALAAEIFLGVLQIVLIEFELRLHELQPIRGGGISGGLLGELRYLILAGGDLGLQLRDALGQLFLLSGGGSILGSRGLSVAQCGGEGLIQFVVGQAKSLASLVLFVGGVGERGRLTGRLEQAVIDQRGQLQRRLLCGKSRRRVIASPVIPCGAGGEQQREADGRDVLAVFGEEADVEIMTGDGSTLEWIDGRVSPERTQ